MAFRIVANYPKIEYRGMREGISQKTNRRWVSLILEDDEANQIEVGVPNDMQRDIVELGLFKGDMLSVSVVAVATADGNSYVQLRAFPELVDGE